MDEGASATRVNQKQITASAGCPVPVTCSPDAPRTPNLFHWVGRVDVVVHQPPGTAAVGHLASEPILAIHESEIARHLRGEDQALVSDRIDRGLVPRATVT